MSDTAVRWNGLLASGLPLSLGSQMADGWVADSVDDLDHADGHQHLSVRAIINFLKVVSQKEPITLPLRPPDSSQPSLAQPSLTLQSFPYGGCESVELSYQSGKSASQHVRVCVFYMCVCVSYIN